MGTAPEAGGSAASTKMQPRTLPGRAAQMTGTNSPALLWATSTRAWSWSVARTPARTASTTRGQNGGPCSVTRSNDGTAASQPSSARLSPTGRQVRGPTEGLWTRTKLAAMAGTLAERAATSHRSPYALSVAVAVRTPEGRSLGLWRRTRPGDLAPKENRLRCDLSLSVRQTARMGTAIPTSPVPPWAQEMSPCHRRPTGAGVLSLAVLVVLVVLAWLALAGRTGPRPQPLGPSMPSSAARSGWVRASARPTRSTARCSSAYGSRPCRAV